MSNEKPNEKKKDRDGEEFRIYVLVIQAVLGSLGVTVVIMVSAFLVSFLAMLLFPSVAPWEIKVLEEGAVLESLILFAVNFVIGLFVTLKRAKRVLKE